MIEFTVPMFDQVLKHWISDFDPIAHPQGPQV